MKIYTETTLSNFEFWGGATETIKYLQDCDFELIENNLEELNPDGMSDTEVNDFFWFDDDTIAEWLGYSSFEELMETVDADEE